jgi:ribosomal protein S6
MPSNRSSLRVKVGRLEGEEVSPLIGLKKLESESVDFDYHTGRHKLVGIVQDASKVIQGFELAFKHIEQIIRVLVCRKEKEKVEPHVE